MQITQSSMLQSLRAVQASLDQNAGPLASVVQTGARKQLDEAIKALSMHASDQTPVTSRRIALALGSPTLRLVVGTGVKTVLIGTVLGIGLALVE